MRYIRSVKKALVYILLPFLLLNSSVTEFGKLPALVSHYHEHHALGNTGFLEFLSMHYLGNDINDNDQEKDMRLPFKKVSAHSLISFNIPASRYFELPVKPLYGLKPYRPVPPDYLLPQRSLESLFRPPRA